MRSTAGDNFFDAAPGQMAGNFTRTIESFVCKICGREVRGDGYTNHCPQCLWSVHCDVNPGDREEPCRGLMEPVAILIKHSVKHIVHRCQKCKIERQVRAGKDDDQAALLALPIVDPHFVKARKGRAKR